MLSTICLSTMREISLQNYNKMEEKKNCVHRRIMRYIWVILEEGCMNNDESQVLHLCSRDLLPY